MHKRVREDYMSKEIIERAMKDPDAAKYSGMSESFLRQSRVTGNPNAPPFIKIGRSVRYLRDDLDKWLESRRRNYTHQNSNISKSCELAGLNDHPTEIIDEGTEKTPDGGTR